MNNETQDVLIIGGGPVGLFGLYCAGLHHLRCTLVERLDRIGGQLEHLYPEKPIYDVGGFPVISGRDLIEQLKRQAFQYPAQVLTGVDATMLNRGQDDWQVVTSHGTLSAKTVVITGGIGEFRPRRFNKTAIDEWEGRGLYYVVTRLDDFRDKQVLVVGGGDSAADWAMAVADRARAVTMIHRRDTFQCHLDSLAKLRSHPRVKLTPRAELVALNGDATSVRQATILRNDRNVQEIWPVDAVIVAIGLLPGTDRFRNWGLAMAEHELTVATDMSTNLPGVFAAGDIVTYPGKVKLIAVGFGEVAIAVESARRFLASWPRTI